MRERHGVADAAVADGLDAGDDVADFAGQQLVHRLHARLRRCRPGDIERLAGRHHLDLRPRLDLAVHDADIGDDAQIGVEVAVKDERAQGLVRVAVGRRDVVDDGFQDLVRADALLWRGADGLGGVNRQHFFDLLGHAVRLGGGQVDLVDDRDDLQIAVHRQVDVGERLRFDALGGVHDQHGAFAGGQRAGDFIGEVHMAGRVNQIQFIRLAVVGAV